MNLKLPEEPYFAAEVRHAVITDGVSRIVMSAHGKGADLHPRERLPNRLKGSRADPFLPRRVERRGSAEFKELPVLANGQLRDELARPYIGEAHGERVLVAVENVGIGVLLIELVAIKPGEAVLKKA